MGGRGKGRERDGARSTVDRRGRGRGGGRRAAPDQREGERARRETDVSGRETRAHPGPFTFFSTPKKKAHKEKDRKPTCVVSNSFCVKLTNVGEAVSWSAVGEGVVRPASLPPACPPFTPPTPFTPPCRAPSEVALVFSFPVVLLPEIEGDVVDAAPDADEELEGEAEGANHK